MLISVAAVVVGAIAWSVMLWAEHGAHDADVGQGVPPASYVAAYLLLMLASLIGCGGLILGIIAATSNRGRTMGIAAIIVSTVGPTVLVSVWSRLNQSLALITLPW